jgi:hypothetical protein
LDGPAKLMSEWVNPKPAPRRRLNITPRKSIHYL